MRAIWAICRRDLVYLFTTPLAWLVLFAWLFIVNLTFFLFGIFPATDAGAMSPEPLHLISLQLGAWLLTLLAPAITMNTFASEHAGGTIQLLMTVPIREYQLVLGKFLAAATLLLTMMTATLPQPLLLHFISDAGGLQALIGYLGFALLCCFLAALGVWISVLVNHPIAAYVITFGAIALLQLLGLVGTMEDSTLYLLGRHLGLAPRFGTFFAGDLRLADVCYFLGGTGIFLAFAHSALAARRVHG